jgi:hypothetical protein
VFFIARLLWGWVVRVIGVLFGVSLCAVGVCFIAIFGVVSGLISVKF